MVEMNDIGRYVLLASCPLQKGIAARLTQFVYDMGSEIIDYDQYVDIANHHFFCRMEWDAPSRTMQHNEVLTRFQAEIVAPFDLSWDLRLNDRPQRLAVFVTRELAHLYMLIMKCISGQWNASIELIISNHPDLSPEAARFGIPYHHLPVDKKGFSGEEYTISTDVLAYEDMGIGLDDQSFKGVKRDAVPIGDRIFRMPYFDSNGRMTIQQWNTASLGVDYRIGPRETKIETFTFDLPEDITPGELIVTARLYYSKLVSSVGKLLNVPEEEYEPILVNEHSTKIEIFD